MDISNRVKRLHDRLAGTQIRKQTVESVEIVIDTNGPEWELRYFVFVHFKEPELPANMREELKLLKRVFWNTDFAQALLSEADFEAALVGEIDIPDDRWILSDELRGGE